ncbi:MAG: hypothetical protein LBP59_16380 [Planctomycetaceae bacterium]|nr:hypothetical protein [Planctomycetaceae bacterium]
MQAGRPRSVGLACFSGSQAFRLGSFRFAGGTLASQDRGRLACKRLYSTANERRLDRNRLLVCLAAKCRRDARDPSVCESLLKKLVNGYRKLKCDQFKIYPSIHREQLRILLSICMKIFMRYCDELTK